MKKIILSLCFLTTAGMMFASDCCAPACDANECNDCEKICAGGHPYLSIRSQSINAARDLVGWQSMINKFETDGFYGAFAITPEYTRSFKPCRIAGFYFGDDLQKGTLTISGSRKGTEATDAWGNVSAGNPKRESHEWLADYFGLAPTFESTVRFTPRITNFMVDFNLYLGFEQISKGAFFRIHAPFVHSSWELNMCEDVVNPGTLGFQEGYMAATAVDYSDLPETFEAAMQGVTFGDMQEAIKYGKISGCKQTKNRISDIEMAVGWNFLQDEDYHFGLMVRASLPTGNKAKAEYLFEPIIGAGGHIMLGAGLTSSAHLWTSNDEETTFKAYMDINVGHYFNTKQIRSFDLTGKKNSRYMLIQEIGTPVENLYAETATQTYVAPSHQYRGNLFPLINKSTCCMDVSIDYQIDGALKIAYNRKNLSLDVGYNVWGRSGERFKKDCCTDCCLERNKYALKGDAFIYGFATLQDDPPHTFKAVALSATEDKATINGGTNTPNGTAYTFAQTQNPTIDNAYPAFEDDATEMLFANKKPAATNQTKTSYQPKLLTCDDLAICDTPDAISHKVFFHMGYSWPEDMEENEWIPFLGLGGEVEFAGQTDGYYAAISQWGIWVKGGLSFD